MTAGAECRRCGFVACLCHRGERGPYVHIPRDFGDEYEAVAGKLPHRESAKPANPTKTPVEAPMHQTTETAAATPKKRQRAAGGPGSRSVTLPAEAVHAFFLSKGFRPDVAGNEVTYKRTHDECCHLTLTVYTTLPHRSGGDSRALGEDAIRVTALFTKQQPGRAEPFRKSVFKSARVYRTGTVEGCLERAAERAREAYAACSEFLKVDKCFACEATLRRWLPNWGDLKLSHRSAMRGALAAEALLAADLANGVARKSDKVYLDEAFKSLKAVSR